MILTTGVASLDLSNKHFEEFSNIKNLKGIRVYNEVLETPPSVTNSTWYLNFYDPSDKESKEKLSIPDCPEDSQLCGVTTVSVPNKEQLVSQVVSFSSALKPDFEQLPDDLKDMTGLTVKLNGANWGRSTVNAQIDLICTDNKDEKLELVQWDMKSLHLKLESQAVCSKSKGDDKKEKPKNPNDNTKSWGWFTWLFIFMVIILAGYIIGGAWVNVNRGSSNEFLNELFESLVEFVSMIPHFVKEIFSKISGRSSERGGYSAV